MTKYLIVPLNQFDNENIVEANLNMDFIKFLSDMQALAGIVIPISVGFAAWNKLRKTGRWETSKQARNDPDFQDEFLDLVSGESYWDE